MDIQKLIIDPIKQKIWEHAKEDLPTVQAAMNKAGKNDNTEKYWKKVLSSVRPRKLKATLDPEYVKRYRDAKYAYEQIEFPNWIKEGHFLEPIMPDTTTANGLTNFITQYLNWCGQRATRISSAGRVVKGKYIPSTTRKGSADISSTINGKSVMFEVKCGSDRPSPAQLKEQAKERKAGGEYFFTHSVEEFFRQLDGMSKQSSIFEMPK